MRGCGLPVALQKKLTSLYSRTVWLFGAERKVGGSRESTMSSILITSLSHLYGFLWLQRLVIQYIIFPEFVANNHRECTTNMCLHNLLHGISSCQAWVTELAAVSK